MGAHNVDQAGIRMTIVSEFKTECLKLMNEVPDSSAPPQ